MAVPFVSAKAEKNGDPSAVLVQLFEEIYRFITDGFYEWKEGLQEVLL